METEFTLLNSKLAEMADNLELAEEMIWRLFCEYQAQPFDVEVEYPDSFAIHDKSREITDLQTLSTCGSTDPRVLAGITASILDLLELDTDELATITDPELLNPESVQEPGELPPDEMPVMMAKSNAPPAMPKATAP
jgi:hypothetical protein